MRATARHARDRILDPHERGRVPEVMAATGAMLSGRGTYEVTVVCPEFGADEARGWIGSGEVPNLAVAHDVLFVDIDSGHSPTFTQPAALARLLDEIA